MANIFNKIKHDHRLNSGKSKKNEFAQGDGVLAKKPQIVNNNIQHKGHCPAKLGVIQPPKGSLRKNVENKNANGYTGRAICIIRRGSEQRSQYFDKLENIQKMHQGMGIGYPKKGKMIFSPGVNGGDEKKMSDADEEYDIRTLKNRRGGHLDLDFQKTYHNNRMKSFSLSPSKIKTDNKQVNMMVENQNNEIYY